MVLFSRGNNGHRICPKSMVPERIINMTKESNSSAPLNGYEAGWTSTMSKSKSPNAGSEFLPREGIGRTNNPSIPVLFPDIFHKDEICSPVSATPHAGDKGFILDSRADLIPVTDAKGYHVTKDIFMQTDSTLTEGNYHRGTDLASSGYPLVIIDSGATVHTTGLLSVFSSITLQQQNVFLVAANGEEMPTIVSGCVSHDRFELNNVHYIPNMGDKIIFSLHELDKLGYFCGFGVGGKCTVGDVRTNEVIGEGHLVNNDYVMEYLRIPLDREPLPEGLL